MLDGSTDKDIMSRFREDLSALQDPAEPLPDGAFSLAGFIKALDLQHPAPALEGQLDRLAKKVEVVRKLHEAYIGDWRPLPGSGEVSPMMLSVVYMLFAVVGMRFGDLKWVNTALKMSDGICGLEWSQEPGLRGRLLAYLELAR